ncbi:MAG: GNAT family N-acetyltransferase [Rhodospirillales bacterium]|nr:GNAT family N-acetyltransferase [Rhodospirillales bacterium]
MLRIRKVQDDTTPANLAVIYEAQAIMRRQFPGISESDINKLPDQLRDPISYGFVSSLFVAEDAHDRLKGLALMLLFTDINVCYLELISAAPGGSGRGIGDVLYTRVQEEAAALGADALFFECLPDEPALSPDKMTRQQNEARLKFYERFGARPIVGTAYETPITPDATDPPYLVVDMLNGKNPPTRKLVQEAARAILERKYMNDVTQDYVEMVVASVNDDPARLRDYRYVKPRQRRTPAPLPAQVPVVVNDQHEIHHMHDRGYVEAPARVRAIWHELDAAGIARRVAPKHYPDRHILEVQDARLVSYIRRACKMAGAKKSIYPYVFPVRNQTRPPKEQTVLAGYYCIDTFTPLNENAWLAARRAVDCTMTAADLVLEGAKSAYALVRPPGHHAESEVFGGFCYLANAAIAANYLAKYGRVAMLDIDYHHGNGQQDIFYQRNDVLTVSIHGDPSFAYPYFSGFRDEKGLGDGAGYNINLPLPETIEPKQYHRVLADALARIKRFGPTYLVVPAGFDTAKGDPTGTWPNLARDFREIGHAIGLAGYPTLIVQEGGYRVRTLGTNVRNFFSGLIKGQSDAGMTDGVATPPPSHHLDLDKLRWRDAVRRKDAERIRALVSSSGAFTPEESAIAAEQAARRLSNGVASGYEFILAELNGRLVAYACFGRIEGTEGSFDLYAIAVDPACQGEGIGGMLLEKVEASVKALGGVSLYADTASSDNHRDARAFFVGNGFHEQARLEDFYRSGSAKIIYEKLLTR